MIWDKPQHRATIRSTTTAVESAAGYLTKPTFTDLQTDVPCLINTASSSEREAWGRLQITVTHIVAFKASVLTADIKPGMKIIGDDGSSYTVHGIRKGRAFMMIPAFVFVDVEQGLN